MRLNNILKKVSSKYLCKKIKNKKNIRIMSLDFEISSQATLLSEIVYNFESSFECLFIKNQPNSYNITDLTLNSTNFTINQGKKFTCDNLIIYVDKKTLNK